MNALLPKRVKQSPISDERKKSLRKRKITLKHWKLFSI